MINLRRLIASLTFSITLAAVAIAAEHATVTWIIDGDTVRVRLRGRIETVRLIGVDAPETGYLRPAEPFHTQATAFAIRLAKRKRVRLEKDPTSDDRDRHGRLLRYVWLPDGRLLNAEIIAAGWAEAMRRFRYVRRVEFLALEQRARRTKKGRWAFSRRD